MASQLVALYQQREEAFCQELSGKCKGTCLMNDATADKLLTQ